MTKNRTPGITPAIGVTRIKGKALSYYSPKYQRWVTKSWPRGQGADSLNRALNRTTFTNMVRLIKSVDPSEYQDAMDLSKGTPYLYRDLLMKAAMGTLVSFTDQDGRLWMPTRDAIQSIQPMLDSISASPGAILYRNSAYWTALDAPSQDSILFFTTSPASLDWVPTDTYIQLVLDAISSGPGSILYRSDTEWVALPPGAAGQFLGMDALAEFPEWSTPAGAGGDVQLIGHAVATGGNTTASLSVGSIPSTGKNLIIRQLLRGTSASTTNTAMVQFNADSSAHYDYYEENRFGNTSSNNQTSGKFGLIHSSGETAGRFCGTEISIEDYAQSTIMPCWQFRSMFSSAGTYFIDNGGGWWHQLTAAINSVTITPSAGGFFTDGSIMSVYMAK